MNHPHERNNEYLAWSSPSRRAIITGGALGLAALALAGCERKSPLPAPSGSAIAKNSGDAQGLTTLDARIVAGDKLDPKKPYRRLAMDDPQKMVVREDLYHANAKRSATRKALAAFGHITDTHIMDPTSPAQTALAFLKPTRELADKETAYFRPQDSLTIQVMDAMIRRLNAVRRGPATGRLFDFYISTGDASDNRGTNEVHAFIETLNGEKTSAFAFPGNPTSLQSPISLPEAIGRFIWQPTPPKSNSPSRVWQDKYGFPVAKHLLFRASELVSTEGANVPWYSGFGNHDQLAHGGVSALETPIENYYAAMATSDKLIVGLPKGDDYKSFVEKMNSSTQPQIKKILATMPGRSVKPSAERRQVSKTEFMSAHLINAGPHGPAGHGFTVDNVRTGTAYYRFQLTDGMVGLMLDTTDPTGGGRGSIDSKQAAWLESELNRVSAVRYDEQGNTVYQDVKDQLVVLFSHHPSSSFGPLRTGSTDNKAITSQELIHELIGCYPNVVLWLNGHYHRNTVWPRRSNNGPHGFWEVNTASHVDFPQQSRSVEVIDNMDGSLSIVGVMIDHSDALRLNYSTQFTSAELAAFSAELALNSPDPSAKKRTGAAKDQNVELLLKKPF
ncbi:TIGR03767 family metallophosphoesterase [Arthrobacter livingstonensis]|uniref:TIGR03767 family metallophosphoesterase n=1 Tax=Arthrobacter livingstonensis TaxID=670078 RepID=A0A2V5LB79_9MICC|nr:TIGR03767 family metallophosphoesterase [Arthrobacter livingstonensis]PYI68779.1 TIGR03767 family metallophosphoesterase [Arthrobacter livingstonensis]